MDECGRPQAIANTGPCEISEDPDNPMITGVSEISSPISQHSIKLIGFQNFQKRFQPVRHYMVPELLHFT